MPIYEYECTKCGNHMEVWQKFSDSPVTQCDSCQGMVRKVISQSAFHLKGTGWYVTDYSKSGNRSGEAKKTETKAETKTEAATTTAKDSGTAKES